MAKEEQEIENLGASLTLGGRIDVFPDSLLPDLGSAGGPAFTARLKGDSRTKLMAVICTSGLPARFDLVNAMRTIDHPSILRLREGGIMMWSPHNAHYYALAYEVPQTQRFRKSHDEIHPPMSEDSINRYFITPLIGALLEFQRTDIVHGSIRLNNIFWRDGSTAAPQLGECLSAPTGINQPVLFEPLERAMSIPIGRGPGLHADDCYAFGVTLAIVALGCNTMQGMDDKAIIQSKIERGSFSSIIGNKRLAGSHVELLRGLLVDDARQRWNASDLELWLTGRRLTPKNSDIGRRASRHIAVAGKEYWQTKPLANALANNVSEAVKIIESSSLEKWLLRSLGDEDRAKSIDEALLLHKESAKSAHAEDQLVTRTCIALDPPSPIHYRGVSLMPGGISTMLAEAMTSGSNTQIISEIILNQFVTFWVNQQNETKTELVPLAQQLERMRGILEKTSFGNGIERVAYELNPTLQCLSPMLRNQYVASIKQILPAIERAASQSDRPREPIDRHIAAFIIVRDKRNESLFTAMSGEEGSSRRGLAMATLFGEMQYRHGPDHLPALANWILPLLDPCIKNFLSKPFQEKVRRQAKETADQGNLIKLLEVVDDIKRIEHDEEEFLMARQMYQDIEREKEAIEIKLKQRGLVAREVGRPVAATISSAIAIIFIAIAILRSLLHNIG